MQTETKVISRIERLNSSVNGNPRFLLGFQDCSEAITGSDISDAYEIGNPGCRVGSCVKVRFSRAGRIQYIEAA